MAAPEKNIKVGSIQIAIWANETDKGTFRSVTFDKSYKDGDKGWKKTTSFKPNDLALLQIGITKALEYLYIKDIIVPQKDEGNTPSF